jgi:hypothetical protein
VGPRRRPDKKTIRKLADLDKRLRIRRFSLDRLEDSGEDIKAPH